MSFIWLLKLSVSFFVSSYSESVDRVICRSTGRSPFGALIISFQQHRPRRIFSHWLNPFSQVYRLLSSFSVENQQPLCKAIFTQKTGKAIAEGMRSSILSVLNVTGEDVGKFSNVSRFLLTPYLIPNRISQIILSEKIFWQKRRWLKWRKGN